MCKVVNRRCEAFDVYIGRGSTWGNPYRIGPEGSRAEVIEKYREYMEYRLMHEPLLAQALGKLRGKRLGCYCKPSACHGDVLVELIEEQLK